MYIWSRSAFYRAYVVGGLVAVVALTLVVSPVVPNPALAGLPVGAWAVGLLTIQGRFLWADRAQMGVARHPAPASPHDPPADPYAALSLSAASADAPARMHGFAWRWFLCLAGGTVLCCVAGALSVSGLVDPFIVAAPPLALIFAGYLLIPRTLDRAVGLGDEWLEALGLQTIAMPGMGTWIDAGGDVRPRLQGATIFGGKRHGRRVRAAIALKATAVAVECAVPPFRAVTNAGRFVPVDGTPDPLAALLARTGSPSRWRSAEVVADGETIEIRRRRSGPDAPDWWLDDLWLAERLADAARG